MPRIDDNDKRQRLERIHLLLARNARGLNEGEIADEVNIGRRTVNNYLQELEYQGKAFKDGIYWFPLVLKESQLRSFDLSPEEAVTLYLGARLLSKQQDKRNEPAETALLKLASVLKADAGVGAEIEQAARELALRPVQKDYQPIFRDVVRGYIYRKKIEIAYRPLNWNKSFLTTFSTYLLEPSPIGFTTYLIGHSSIVNARRTYKLERIESVRLTKEDYAVPPDFPGLEILRNAWSIVTGEETIRVVLRFSSKVKARVLETHWHPSQETRIDPDHPESLLWEVQVADTLDLVPWIRSWGADCEVVEPEDLREKLREEVRSMTSLYKIEGTPEIPLYQILWAKTNDEKTTTHPLICHMIDVSMTARILWEEALPNGIRSDLAAAMGIDIHAAGRALAFWAGLHDLGKASRCFQQKYPPAITALKTKGLDFLDMPMTTRCLHGHITCKTLEPLLIQETCMPKEWAKRVSSAVGGHHGEWPTNLDTYTATPLIGAKAWDKVRRQLFLRLREILDPPHITPPALSQVESNTFFTLFSAFVSVADWLGSMEDYFQPYQGFVDLETYAHESEEQARKALQENGWLGWKPPQTPIALTDLCKVPSPRPLQQAVIDLSAKLNSPGLVLIEAPTGEGKTEAALYLADHWARTLQQRGAYVAMPTMATSNQMHKRVTEVLKRRYTDETFVGYHLLHGNALLEDNESVPRLTKVYADKKDDNGNIGAASWFTKQKRGLLAPFAVGTVDQALLSILQTPHFFVRLFGLSHKTIIFDEVHAYDTYMDKLFFHLLDWLQAVGASVVILSATLPEATRRNIMEAYTGQTFSSLQSAEYPAITWTTGDEPQNISFAASAPRDLWLERIERDTVAIAKRLESELKDGGCAAVLCNTVGRAQEIYRAIQERNIVPEEDLHLFHARFPLEWRHHIEGTVTGIFDNRASDDAPRRKSIVVATQVIEQSLDLDFDLMISDLAPVDLILQRAGRLHRNPQRKNRPMTLQKPRLLLAMPETKDGIPVFDKGDKAVYDHYFLLRSYLALKDCLPIAIPRQTQALIESVYGPEASMPEVLSEEYRKALANALIEMTDEHDDAKYEAQKKLVRSPQDPQLLLSPFFLFDEENPDLHIYMRAATRQSPPSVTLICLHHTAAGLTLDPEIGSTVINPNEEPALPTTRALFGRKIEVTNWYLVQYFTKQSPPHGWKKSPWLRHARCVAFEGGVFKPEDESWTLELDRKLGLVFNKGA